MRPFVRKFATLFLCLALCVVFSDTSSSRGQTGPGGAVPKWSPALKPTMTGPINVGVILILFPDTQLNGGIPQFKSDLDKIAGMTQEEYFKIYSNNIAWPVAKIYPSENEADIYHAPQCYGYYCRFDLWGNPIGWRGGDEGGKRAAQLRADALNAARSKSRAGNYKTLAYSYITTFNPDKKARPDLRRYWAGILGGKPDAYPDPVMPQVTKPKVEPPVLMNGDQPFDAWDWYRPSVRWGEPMWPNSIIQFNNASGGTFAHEFGHVMGAPDIYRIGRANDGIGGTPVLLSYGPTATAFSRFYHHGFVPAANYPTITQSGTYTLSPRHITPEKDEALGYIIPSKDPHYFYHIEYIYGENPALRSGGGDEVHTQMDSSHQDYYSNLEGVLVSVINLGESNYLGSPDGFYTYRPNDPWFRGLGETGNCLFGASFNRQDFNMKTEPSSRLPNLLDGGVVFKNITEHRGTATFDVEIDKTPIPPAVYQASVIPLVQLESVDEVLPTSFRMTVVSKFRGEPLVDQFGMCWSTSKNPQVTNDHFTLTNCDYDMFRGRALNLKPNTKYYVRGWANNAKGLRYSDEELEVKTPALTDEINEVGPLLLDSFSDNGMLHDRFSNDSFDRYGGKNKDYESYAPVAVLCKLAAYYHPDGLLAPHPNVPPTPNRADTLGPGHELIADVDPKAGKLKTPVNFGRLHWDPYDSDPPWRTVETLSLFEEMRDQSRAARMQSHTLGKEFLTSFDQMFRHKSQPLFQPVTEKNLSATVKLIKNELINARPVMIIECPQAKTSTDTRIQWGLIDGFKDDASLHIDFPRDTEILKVKRDRVKYATLDSLVVKDYDLAVVIHIVF